MLKTYHWYDEPENVTLKAERAFLGILIKSAMSKSNMPTKVKLAKAFCVSRSRLYSWMDATKDYCGIKVRNLKRLCELSRMSYDQLESFKVLERRFHIDVASKPFLKLKTHMINEGHIDERENICVYSNKDPVCHLYFKNYIEAIGGYLSSVIAPYHGGLRSYGDPTTGRALMFAGVPAGDRTLRGDVISLGREVLSDQKLLKYHYQATLTEEGYVSLMITTPHPKYPNTKRAKMEMGWRRAVAVTDKLPSSFLNSIPIGRKSAISFQRLPKKIKQIVRNNPPKVLMEEWNGLSKLLQKIPNKKPERIMKRRRDQEVVASWAIRTSNSNVISEIHEKIGMLSGTWKDEAFRRKWEVFSSIGIGKLTQSDVKKIYKVNRSYGGHGVPSHWIKQKIRELFPKVEWLHDKLKWEKVLTKT